jgi:hypothetical protein
MTRGSPQLSKGTRSEARRLPCASMILAKLPSARKLDCNKGCPTTAPSGTPSQGSQRRVLSRWSMTR